SSSLGLGDTGRERGGRRQRVYGYLKAANELRQSYTSQLATSINNVREYGDEFHDTPGAFPDVEIARSGHEEMVIFPSYARKLSGNKATDARRRKSFRSSTDTIDAYRGEEDEFEQSDPLDWEEYENENAVVAVDVRGWLYSPHRGPMTRKNRLMVALARRLSGVPAPGNPSTDNGDGSDKITSQGEDEIVNKEMQFMISKAESEADPAWKSSARNGSESECPGRPPLRTATTSATGPAQMTKDELSVANAHLMERLQPFLANPMMDMPVTVFFFNDEQSQSRSVITDASGHFILRAALPFVPTHIRVLASENLSAAKEIKIIEPSGVSLISDIDDTVKHSAIANGAKEMFRNTFVRELSDLTVRGVDEWYTQLTKLGVEIHYVSNAPWQLYPLLERFFKLVGLPPGSIHLKQYSGMLQGIFEPTAERKRASLERILKDFPDRKFILVGDSGEADLEVYTEIVLANPGRILGIFIRDVTTSDHALFFEKSVDYLEKGPSRSRSTGQLIQDQDSDAANRPSLPPRRPTMQSTVSINDARSIDNGDCIDLREEGEEGEVSQKPGTLRPPPMKPSKPQTLRTASTTSDVTDCQTREASRRKPVPPVPPRRSAPSVADNTSRHASNQDLARTQSSDVAVRSKPPAPPPPPPRRTNTGTSTSSSVSSSKSSTPALPAPQRQQQSYPVAAASAAYQYASDRIWLPSPSNVLRSAATPITGRTSSSSVNEQEGYGSSGPSAPLPNKREELWRRRWERANEILQQKGVVLGSWRVGNDVQDVCIWLVKDAMKEMRDG
ncbi:phosphatidate phosphatase App1 family protein, partial [Aspergillus ruber CBS 135680]